MKVLIADDNLFTEEKITSRYTDRVNVEFDSEDIGSHTMNRFATYKFVAKHLRDYLAENCQVVRTTHANAVRVEAI